MDVGLGFFLWIKYLKKQQPMFQIIYEKCLENKLPG